MKKNLKKIRNKKGFTLVEILTVVALIAILFVIFVPRLDFATNKVRESGLQSDFRSYQLAFEQVARQNSGFKSFASTGEPTYNESKALANALNSYLDKKLQVQVEDVASGNEDTAKGVMSLKIDDPWKMPYKFIWDWDNDCVYVFSSGPDKDSEGETATALLDTNTKTDGGGKAENATNEDNYSISVRYDVEGLSIKTSGFDNNIDR